jgi:hypothetical protein
MGEAKRRSQFRAAVMEPRGIWWFFSFIDEKKEGRPFVGGCCVRGLTAQDALVRSHLVNANPRVEAQPTPFPTGVEPPEEFRDRLLSPEECAKLRDLLNQ